MYGEGPGAYGLGTGYQAQFHSPNQYDKPHTQPEFEEQEKFPPPEKSAWQDLFFLFLFVLHFGGIAALLGYSYSGASVPVDSDRIFDFPYEWGGLLAILALVGLIFSSIYLQLIKAFPKAMIYIGMSLMFAVFAAQSMHYLAIGQVVAGSCMLILTIFYSFYMCLVRSRIPFAVEMITTAVGIVHVYPGMQVTAYVSLLVQLAWSALWTFTLYRVSGFDQQAGSAAIVFLIFSFYWVFEVIKNVVHVTVCGTSATWYFLKGSPLMPEHPTVGSLTYSFGSICLGSLIVAIITTMRTLLRAFSRDNSILSAIVGCFLYVIDALARYFNHYAFCQVAIYGKPFCTAAIDTWELINSSAIAAIINDNIIYGVLLTGSLFGAVCVGTVGAFISLAWPTMGDPVALFFAGGLIGFVMATLTLQVVDSAIASIFVCFAEHPEALKDTNPILYHKFIEADTLVH